MKPVFSLNDFLRVLPLAALFIAGAAAAHPQTHPEKGYDTASNWLQFVPVAAGAVVAAYEGDLEGEKQLLRAAVATELAGQALKYSLRDTSWNNRPNQGDYSFPSEHTSIACSGAAFLGGRYGWEYGAPALAVAATVGYARVKAEKHHVRDVIGGCALSYGVGMFFVTKDGEEELYPVVGPDFIGFRWKFGY
ncbi:MAG: phosphatase PAP2 family protein [Alphaproteobacteria bacterium]|nr:phosphatase PAP2 family protein [Alphaproteobacteria bacterium]